MSSLKSKSKSKTRLSESRKQMKLSGKAARLNQPLDDHKHWLGNHRPHPIELIEETNIGRIPELVPLRHTRMMTSPFTLAKIIKYTQSG